MGAAWGLRGGCIETAWARRAIDAEAARIGVASALRPRELACGKRGGYMGAGWVRCGGSVEAAWRGRGNGAGGA